MIISAAPLFLAELTAYDPALGTTRVLRYASRQGLTTKPSETPANTYYDPRIKQPVDISRTMFSGGTTQGRSTYGVGDLILYNDDGLLDDLNDLGFDGQPVTIRRATALNPSYPSDFVTVLVGTMEQAEFTSTEVRIKLRDRLFTVASAPFQTTKYAGTNVLPAGLEGVATDLKGKPKPVCYGAVKNIPMPCVNTSKLIYQVNDGAVASVDAVYDRGIALAASRDWTTAATPGGTGGVPLSGIAYGAGVWVVITNAGEIISSSNKTSWTIRVSGAGAGASVAYGNGIFVVVTVTTQYTSPDGIVWTSHGAPPGGFVNMVALAYSTAASLWVIAGGNVLYTSPDGFTWTSRTVPLASSFMRARYGLGLMVVAGYNRAVVMTSVDCITWTVRAQDVVQASDSMYDLWFSGTRFAAVGVGVILSSGDGITWTRIQTTGTYPNNFAVGADPVNGTWWVPSGHAALGVSDVRTSEDGETFVSVTTTQWGTSYPSQFATDGISLMGAGINQVMFTGVSAGADYGSLVNLLDDNQAPLAGEYRAYAAGGYFRLGSPPTGLVTADATQGAAAANRTAAQLYKLALTRAGLSASDYSAADVTALDSANSAVLGYWTMDELFCADVCDMIASSVGAWWGVDRTGVFRIKQFTAPSGTAVLALTANDMKAAPERISTNDVGNGIPIYRSTVRWGKYYATLTTDLAGGVDDASRAAFAQEWRDATISDATVVTAHPLSQPLIEESLLTTATDALAEATRRLALRSVKRDRYELVVELNTDTEVIDLGDVIEVQHPRFALSVIGSDTGMKFRVLDIAPNARNQELRLSVWGRSTSRNRITSTGAYRVTSTGAYRVTTQST